MSQTETVTEVAEEAEERSSSWPRGYEWLPEQSLVRGMKLTAEPMFFPAACLLTGKGSGVFLDLLGTNRVGEREYVHVQKVLEMGRAIGMVRGDELRNALDRVGEVEAANEALAQVNEELREELLALQRAVRNTLIQGAVRYRKDGEEHFKLRPPRGEEGIEL